MERRFGHRYWCCRVIRFEFDDSCRRSTALGEAGEKYVAAWMAEWLPAGSRVLDLGGGHGRYAAAMAEQGMVATLFDKAVALRSRVNLRRLHPHAG